VDIVTESETAKREPPLAELLSRIVD